MSRTVIHPFMHLALGACLLSAATAWGAAPANPPVAPPVPSATPRATSTVAPPAATSIAPPATTALACLIQPEQMADLGTAVVGVVQSIDVERGDRVRKGQVLLRLRTGVERASADAMRLRSQSEAELRGAQAAQALAQAKHERAKNLFAQQFVSGEAVQIAATEMRLAQEKVAQARDNLSILRGDLQVSQEQIDQRTLRAPFDGVVVDRFANVGERVEEKPLLRLAAIDRLRVEMVAPIAQFGLLRVGQAISVRPELPGADAREARIVQVDQVLDPASNTFRLRAELTNASAYLPAGLRCRAELPAAPRP